MGIYHWIVLGSLIAPFGALISSSVPAVSQAIANATNTTGATIPTGAALGLELFLALFLIIGLPIAIFIILFISNALTAIFYNLLSPELQKYN
jgi:hypothetical protein